MKRDENWFDAVGKYDWREQQIEAREQQRKPLVPLTTAEIERLVSGWDKVDDGYVWLVRAVERLHGIGV